MESYPSKTIRYDLLVVLGGVACALAAERFVDHFSKARLISTIAFFLNALNFLHGKVVALDDEDYNRALIHRPGFGLADFGLNVSVVLTFVFMALYLDRPKELLISNIVVRGVDLILVLLVKRVSHELVLSTAQTTWLGIDCFALVIFAAALASGRVATNPVGASTIFLVVVMTDIAIDYTVNASMYFSSATSWSKMAEIWDTAQERGGDIYRRRIILPALSSAFNFKDRKFLDLGCGNGCVARAAEEAGAKLVVAVDKSPEMIEAAGQYGGSNVIYRQFDIELSVQPIEGGNFDLIVSCFSLQDCDSIDTPFRLIYNNLAPDGKAIVISENDAAFGGEGSHITTGRRPLDAKSHAGAGRRWLIFWDSRFSLLAQSDLSRQIETFAFSSALHPSSTYITVTRHWSNTAYLRKAIAAKLELAATPMNLRVSGKVEGPILEKYEANPKFSMLILQKKQNVKDNDLTGRLPVIFIAGASGTGKSALCQYLSTKNLLVVNIDDFYLAYDDKRLPRKRSKPDWEKPESVDLDLAARVVDSLSRGNDADVPVYDMQTSTILGHKKLSPVGASAIVVQGLFAFDVFVPNARNIRILLRGSWPRLLYRRIKRDYVERRRSKSSSIWHAVLLLLSDHVYEQRNEILADYQYSCSIPTAKLKERLYADIISRL